MTTHDNSLNNADQYAQQWINDLRKRNSLLNGTWIVTLIMALAFGLSAFYFYHQGQTALLDSVLSKQEIGKLELQLKNQQAKMSTSGQSLAETKAEHERLTRENQAQQEKIQESEGALAVNQDIIDNLNSQLALLKEENEALAASLSQVRASLLSGASNSEVLAGENSRLSDEIKVLNKKLKDRKGAYLAVVKRQKETRSEIDYLASNNDKLNQELESKEQRITSLQTQISQLSASKTSLTEELTTVKSDYSLLEDKLASLMAPIGPASNPTTSKPALSNTLSAPSNSAQGANTTESGFDGLEEIKIQKPRVLMPIPSTSAPAKDKATEKAKASTFDYDKIAIP